MTHYTHRRLPEYPKGKAIGMALRIFFETIASIARKTKWSQPSHHNVEVISNIPYRELYTDEAAEDEYNLFDVYRPIGTKQGDRLPVVIYIHGGGFRILSKDTHFMMGIQFAKQGYVTIMPNYRLCPKYPFPAAFNDSADLLHFVHQHAETWGGDSSQIILAGESAGANLCTSLTIATKAQYPLPKAQLLFKLNPNIRAVMPYCGLHQVSQRESLFLPETTEPIRTRIRVISHDYYQSSPYFELEGSQLAQPIIAAQEFANHKRQFEREMPPFFISCGTKDPVLEDSRRLRNALYDAGVQVDYIEYYNQVHAFFAFVWMKEAKQCWKDSFDFLHNILVK